MPAPLILTTPDPQLEAAWRTQLAPREPIAFARASELPRELLRPGGRVWISDINDPRARLPAAAGTLIVLVGQPHSIPFEQARQNRQARIFLSYDESRTKLAETVDLLDEVAEKSSQLHAAAEQIRRRDSAPPFPRETPPTPEQPTWDFLESALEHLGDRTRLLDEFRRAGRYLLKASKVVFFLRDEARFAADRDGHVCDATHPLALWLHDHPAVLYAENWNGPDDPTYDAPIRQALLAWGTRLLVPLHTKGELTGWVSLGPRADGAPYREADLSRIVLFGRLLERCLERSEQLRHLDRMLADAALRRQYLSGSRILVREEVSNPELPVEVRAVAGEALSLQKEVVQPAASPHRFRVKAGPIPDRDAVWVVWEEAAPEIERIQALLEAHRRQLLQSLGLTLSHELSNPLVSLVTFSQLLQRGDPSGQPPPTGGAAALAQDLALATEVKKLQVLAEHAALLDLLAHPAPVTADLNPVLAEVTLAHGITTRISEEQLVFRLDPRLLRFAFNAIFEAIAANRPDEGTKNLLLSLRTTGAGDQRLAVMTIEGKNLELDGVLFRPGSGGTPNQGRLSVFLAQEILRLHGGTLQSGPGLKGTDVQISLGNIRA